MAPTSGHNLLDALANCSIFGEIASNILVDDVWLAILSANEAKQQRFVNFRVISWIVRRAEFRSEKRF